MATKVFLKCVAVGHIAGWTLGKEYPVSDRGTFSSDRGVDGFLACGLTFGGNKFERIERDCFEHGGKTWFRHTPGDPMPCYGSALTNTICQAEIDDIPLMNARPAEAWSWGKGTSVIGWRYADSEQKQPVAIGWHQWRSTGVWIGKARTADEDESERNDQYQNFAWLEFLKRAAPDVAAVEDTSLPPRIRRIVNEKEEVHAAKKKLAKDAQTKALKERADQLADAGRAMDRVNQDHGHRLGWMR
jgi:hypothetical protein